MEDINRSLSTDLLDDIFKQLKTKNLNEILKRKYCAEYEYVYFDISYRSYSSPSFILLRNAFDSYFVFQQEMLKLCRALNVSTSVTCYSLELFDKFYTKLISNGRATGLLDDLPYSTDLTGEFGKNLFSLTNLQLRYDRLYMQVINDSHFTPHARTICMAVCILIASKQFDSQHLLFSNLKSTLYTFDIPAEWRRLDVLGKIEIKMLSLINFELNITSLKTYVETILIILSRCLFPSYFGRYFTTEKLSQMQTIALILIENFYILQVPFIVKLFQVFNERQLNFFYLKDIEEIENINRDKLLISSAIVGATCLLVNEYSDNITIMRYLSYICEIELERINRSSHAALKHLFVGPYENTNQSQIKTTNGF